MTRSDVLTWIAVAAFLCFAAALAAAQSIWLLAAMLAGAAIAVVERQQLRR